MTGVGHSGHESRPLRVFVYEFLTCGGLYELNRQFQPECSLLREGEAMWRAVYDDFQSLPEVEVVTMRDSRLASSGSRRAQADEIMDVTAASEAEFERLALTSDFTLLIAPEFDQILLHRTRRLEALGVKLLSPNSQFVSMAMDKTKTADVLAAAGLPVPAGVLLEGLFLEGGRIPADFPFPAVLKVNDGAGSMCQILNRPPAEPLANVSRLEQLVAGMPCSISFFCQGEPSPIACPPMQQILSTDGKLQYLGGRRIMDSNWVDRAADLGRRALTAMPATLGYVGVDLILGHSRSGDEDFVIEVNPRITTSYIGLRKIADSNLAAAMLQIAVGQRPAVPFSDRFVQFLADGTMP